MRNPFLVMVISLAFLAPKQSFGFDEKCYLDRYPDVLNNWVKAGSKAIDHWTKFGKAEGRNPDCDVVVAPTPIITPPPVVSSNSFDEKCYLERYPDVLNIWVKAGSKAVDHWTKFGKAEGRIPGCDVPTAPVPAPIPVAKKEIWITPPGKLISELNSFLDIKNIPQWQKSFDSFTGTKLYMVNLDKTHPTYIGDEGVNKLKNFINYTQSKGKKIAFELGAMYSETCDSGPYSQDGMPLFAVRGLSYESGVLKQLSDANVDIDYIVIDGPFIRIFDSRFSNCRRKFGNKMTVEYVADQVITYMKGMKKIFPKVQFVLLTNLPNWNLFQTTSINSVGDRIVGIDDKTLNYEDVFRTAVTRAKDQGIPFASFQIDNPYNFLIYNQGLKNLGLVSSAEVEKRFGTLKKMVDLSKSLNIPSNIILNSEVDENTSFASADFTDKTLKYAEGISSHQIVADGLSVQSWYAVPNKILPETTNFTFANVVVQVASQLKMVSGVAPLPPIVDPSTVFNEACYLARYPDIKNWVVNFGGKAIDHWLNSGKLENRIPGCTN